MLERIKSASVLLAAGQGKCVSVSDFDPDFAIWQLCMSYLTSLASVSYLRDGDNMTFQEWYKK